MALYKINNYLTCLILCLCGLKLSLRVPLKCQQLHLFRAIRFYRMILLIYRKHLKAWCKLSLIYYVLMIVINLYYSVFLNKSYRMVYSSRSFNLKLRMVMEPAAKRTFIYCIPRHVATIGIPCLIQYRISFSSVISLCGCISSL